MKFLALVFFVLLFSTIEVQAQVGSYSPLPSALGKHQTMTLTISSGGTASAAIDLGAYTLVGISFPATFTGTTVTFQQAEAVGGTYQGVYNSAGAVSYTIAQARYYALSNSDFDGVRFLKVVSGSTEGADRILTLHLKGK